MSLTLYLSSLIIDQVKKPFGRFSSNEEAPSCHDASVGEDSSKGVIPKSEFLQIRDQLIAEGRGPADIVFGPDLFDPIYEVPGTPYSDALDQAVKTGAIKVDGTALQSDDLDKPSSDVFPYKSDQEVTEILSRIVGQIERGQQDHLSEDPTDS